jgi:hypothetical protein
MPTPVFLTVDTELVWRHHAAGLALDEIVERSIEPGGVGIGYQLAEMARHRLKGIFFVDPMPALTFGLDVIRRIVDPIMAAGQEVQLHLHPNWTRARPDDGGATYADFELTQYSRDQQRDLIAGAAELLEAAGAASPVAFRAGSFAANDDTLSALAELGFAYDSSHNGAEAPWPSEITLPPNQIAPIRHGGIVQVPVTVIEDLPGTWRPFQICAISQAEMRDALDHAVANAHGAVTIVSHGFELSTRDGTRVNAIHRRRFDALCELLAERRETLPTVHFADRPALPLDRADRPLGPSMLRTRWRQAEQFWSNQVVERVA